jgi:hypothetical protein
MLVLFFVLMQYMISAKAGLVNYVDGEATVHLHEQVAAGTPIQTTAQGHVELLLNPGTFLRIGGSSNVVFDSVDLSHIAVRVVEGTALVEAADIDKHDPIRVTTGNLQTLILSRGLYRFGSGTAVVLDGKLRLADASKTVKKGHQITALADEPVVQNVSTAANDELDRWSEERSSELAKANALAYNEKSQRNTYSSGGLSSWNIYGNRSAWIYSPLLGGFTFVPLGGYRSYYGYSFIPMTVFAGAATFPRPIVAGRPSGTPTTRPSAPNRGGGGLHAPTAIHSSGTRSGAHARR